LTEKYFSDFPVIILPESQKDCQERQRRDGGIKIRVTGCVTIVRKRYRKTLYHLLSGDISPDWFWRVNGPLAGDDLKEARNQFALIGRAGVDQFWEVGDAWR